MQLVCLIHDIGKILSLPPFNEPQHFVVGDTFPLGCKVSEKIVHHRYFIGNADTQKYTTKLGIYKENCGFDALIMVSPIFSKINLFLLVFRT